VKAIDTSTWFECPIAWRDTIKEGSALDFSFLNHKPAGKFGFVKVKDGHFEFEKRPGEQLRFWGTNFALSGPYPEKDLAPGIAKCAAMQGCDLVRIHLYASGDKRLVGPDGKLRPEMLDKMEFLISELEKNGVYIFMDLNDGMPYEWLLGLESKSGENLKLASVFNADLKKATKKLATDFFTHVNPTRGSRWPTTPAWRCSRPSTSAAPSWTGARCRRRSRNPTSAS
jgi:hypothetical protein